MNPESKHVEEKLLDYAYGELGSDDSATVEAHLQSCPRCADALVAMKRVRQTMSRLPVAPAPAKGLDSLIAYAEQTAQRARVGQKRRPAWVRWLVPITGVAALSVVLVISGKVVRTVDPLAARRDSAPEIQSEPPPAAPERPANDPTDLARAEKRSITADELSDSADDKGKAQMVNGPDRPQLAKKIRDFPPARSKSAAREYRNEGQAAGAIAGAANQAAPAPSAAKPRKAREFDEGTDEGVEGGVAERAVGGVPGGVVGGVVGGTMGGAVGGQSKPSAAAPPADDRQGEVARLRQALADGAVGQERARILLRLCDALDALKRQSEADSACNALIREFPNSDEATIALNRQRARPTSTEPRQR